MSEPRFKVGQIVVLIPPSKYAGCVGEVLDVQFCEEWRARTGWSGWLYETTAYPWIAQERLRPYDPPASWDDEDMVWKPGELEGELEKIDE